MSYEEANKKLLLLGVNIEVNFESSENISVKGKNLTVPCVEITNYSFFAVTETHKSVNNIIVAIQNLKLAIENETKDIDDSPMCLYVGRTFKEIRDKLNQCKVDIDRGQSCAF